MASRALRGLSEPDVRGLLGQGAAPRVSLPSFLLISETPDWRALVCLLRVRQGGFCIVAPLVDSVVEALGSIEEAAEGAAVVLTERVCCANLLCSWPTCRGAAWSTSAGPAASGCRGAGRGLRVSGHRWSTGCCLAFAALDTWLSEVEADDPMLDYVTATELPDPGAEAEGLDGRKRSRRHRSQQGLGSPSWKPLSHQGQRPTLRRGPIGGRAHRPGDFSCGPIAPPPGLANPYCFSDFCLHRRIPSQLLFRAARATKPPAQAEECTYGAGGLHQATGQPRGDCIGHSPECLHGAGDSSKGHLQAL